MNGVRVRGLRKSFRGARGRQQVLRGIDLDIGPGEVVGLIGPNGAGKTTLMSCLLGFLFPDGGEVAIDGQPTDDLAIRARTGFVPERMNFDRSATGRSFLTYMAYLGKVADPSKRVDELLERLDIAHAADKKLSQYSRGMLQRIGMAQALLHVPDFLFLDEPTSGLDPNGVMLVREVIADERKRGATVLLNSHALAEVERVCDRVMFLSKGVIAQHETLRAANQIPVAVTLLAGTYDAAAIEAAFGVAAREDVLQLVAADAPAIAEIVRRLVTMNAGVLDVRRHAVDLEEIFRRAK
jgi:ABC-2 type transport system ATP-binding protein